MNATYIAATSFERADAIAAQLASRKDAWVQVGIPERIAYLHRCIKGVQAVAQPWTEATCRAKGIDPTTNAAGEEWLAGPMCVLQNLQQLVKALKARGQPQPSRQYKRSDGQVVAQVFPGNLTDRLLWRGFSAEVWIQPGQPSSQGAIYREKSSAGKVALVLGAGNVSSIAPMDTLYKLFVEDQVVVLKMNPVNEYIGPFLERAFQSLREDGFYDIVYGGADLGSYLTRHPEIDTVHITGSHHTHNAIVWGSTPEEKRRKAVNEPLSKPISSELGCVTPVLVVPGPWSEADIAFQARHVASMVAHNASFNCVAAKAVVTAKGWDQREAFLARLHQELAAIPPRQAYYPGAQQRYQAFLDHYPQSQALAPRTEQIVPWTVIPEVSPEQEEYALTHEAFCGVLAEVTLDVVDAGEFLTQAVDFVNQKVWGTLSCVLLVHPETQKAYAAELEEAIATLRYGGIGLNVWTGINYSLGVTTWGAFPGHSLTDICSGRGVVHNTYLFDHPQKSVVRAPFRIMPTPAWFVTHKNLLQLGKRLTAFEAAPTWDKFLSVILAAIKG